VRQFIVHLLAVIQHQAVRIAALEARVCQNSSNSDRPPATDPPYEKRPASAAAQGRHGVKPGHPGHRQVLLEPTPAIALKPEVCACGQREFPATTPYYMHQVIELAEIQMTVSPLFLGTLLPLQPNGVLVMDERVSWQTPQPRSLWQAIMIPEDRTSCR
jgi:transposase